MTHRLYIYPELKNIDGGASRGSVLDGQAEFVAKLRELTGLSEEEADEAMKYTRYTGVSRRLSDNASLEYWFQDQRLVILEYLTQPGGSR